jgi:hypothetical protein
MNMHEEHPAQTGFMLLDHLNKRDGQKHRHRIIAAGLNLQRRAHAFVQPFTAEQREYRRGVGGADNRANQQPFHQIQIKQPGRHHPGEPEVIRTPTVASDSAGPKATRKELA